MASKTGKTPEALEQEPTIFEDTAWIWDAFWMLNRSRRIGMSIGPIPLSEIKSFCDLFEVRRTRYLIEAIDHLDRIYLDHINQEQKKSKPKAKKGTPKHGRHRRA